MIEDDQHIYDDHSIEQKNNDAASVLLIDLENCPSQLHQLQESLQHYSQVFICYAKSGAKIPLDWLTPLSTAVHENKLTVFKMTTGGKNAADFGISFFAGVLMQQLPAEAHFVIISNDTDLDHVVQLLLSHGRSAERIGTKKEEQEKIAVDTASLPPVNKFCAYLMTHNKNRPTKKETLQNSIKNQFKDSPGTAENVFNVLTAQGVIKISEKKVTYDDAKICGMAHLPG